MRTDRDVVHPTLNKWRDALPPGTLLQRVPRIRGGPGGPTVIHGREIRMVVHVDIKVHPTQWTELCITTVGYEGLQAIEIEHTDFPRSWRKLDVAG